MSLFTLVESAMQTITDINDDWYELPELSDDHFPDEEDGEVEQSLSPRTMEQKVMEEQLLKSKEQYIVDTVRNFIRNVYYSHSLLLRSAGYTSGTICPYDLDPAATKSELRRIMDQCRRLRDEPHMFPTEILKDKFLATIAVLAGSMLSIEQTRTKLLEFKQQLYSPVVDMHQPFSDLLLSKPPVYAMPAFLPDKLHGKHPWNNWLDNSAQSTPGWIAIQQKVPKAGEKLMRNIVLLYDAVQEQFDEDADVGHTLKNNDELPAPGDSFRHMTWSGFCTFPSYHLGFKSGKRKRYDLDGIITVEQISKILCKQHKGAGMELGTVNCPFFRFAMAYRKV